MSMARYFFGILVLLGFTLLSCKSPSTKRTQENLEDSQEPFAVHELSGPQEEKPQNDYLFQPDTSSYRLLTAEEVERLKGKAWSAVKLVQNCRKDFLRTVTISYPFADTIRLDACYADSIWLAADTISVGSDFPVLTTYKPIGTWRHPRTGDLWAFLAEKVGVMRSDDIEVVTSIHIIRPTGRKVFRAIPVASALFLSPDSTQLLLAGERSNWVSFVTNSYCFGAIEVLDISEGEPRSLYIVEDSSSGRSERKHNKSIKAYRMEWRELPQKTSGGRCPRCLWRYPSGVPGSPTLTGFVEQMWSTPDGALLLRLSLKEEYGNDRIRELGDVYILI